MWQYLDPCFQTNRCGHLCLTLIKQPSVEIFLELFASFSLNEIVKAFSDLKCSIDTSIQAIINDIYILTYNDTTTINLLLSYSTSIGRLIVTHSPVVDFTSLINLQSLTVRWNPPRTLFTTRNSSSLWQ